MASPGTAGKFWLGMVIRGRCNGQGWRGLVSGTGGKSR